MNFAIDKNGRFHLHSREGGWDLVVDDKRVHYCLTPVEAVKYMAEEMIDAEVDVEGVRDVCDALARIADAARDAAGVARAHFTANEIAPAIAAVSTPRDAPRKSLVRDASLALGRCTLAELQVRQDRKQLVTLAKAVLTPCFEAWGVT